MLYISVGSDTREAKLAKSRSDVNILAFVNPVSKQVLLLNTPRDYYINISIAPDSKGQAYALWTLWIRLFYGYACRPLWNRFHKFIMHR